jgi:hypothetical protein
MESISPIWPDKIKWDVLFHIFTGKTCGFSPLAIQCWFRLLRESEEGESENPDTGVSAGLITLREKSGS